MGGSGGEGGCGWGFAENLVNTQGVELWQKKDSGKPSFLEQSRGGRSRAIRGVAWVLRPSSTPRLGSNEIEGEKGQERENVVRVGVSH